MPSSAFIRRRSTASESTSPLPGRDTYPHYGRTMRAVVYERTGDPEVLTLIDKPRSDPGSGEMRVRIVRSGVNPTDWKSRRGSAMAEPVIPPQTPNQDGSGVIDAVGQGVDARWVGQRVWVWEAAYQRAEGTAQEYALVPARRVVPLPDDASFDLGASLGVPFLTADRCLTATEGGPHRLGPGTLDGRFVLVAGGAGAVGNAAIQLAHWSDATVITTVSSPEKAQLAAAAGADHVIDYTRQDVESEIRKVAAGGVHTVVEASPCSEPARSTGAVLAPLLFAAETHACASPQPFTTPTPWPDHPQPPDRRRTPHPWPISAALAEPSTTTWAALLDARLTTSTDMPRGSTAPLSR